MSEPSQPGAAPVKFHAFRIENAPQAMHVALNRNALLGLARLHFRLSNQISSETSTSEQSSAHKQETKTVKKKKIAALTAALETGAPLTIEQLAWHLQVHPKHAPGIAEAFGLKPEGRLYPWRRIWRHIHRTEGAQLTGHLAALKERHPTSMVLADIHDLEAVLRVPLIDFASAAGHLGRKSDTLSKALRQRRDTLPFPMISLGPRKRHFRPLEVRLWEEEEIRLDLPEPPDWATVPTLPIDAPPSADANAVATSIDVAATLVDPAKKAVFGQFAAISPNDTT